MAEPQAQGAEPLGRSLRFSAAEDARRHAGGGIGTRCCKYASPDRLAKANSRGTNAGTNDYGIGTARNE